MLNAKLFWQMAITIAILIVGVESVFLYFSIDGKRTELLTIRQELNADALRTTGQAFNELHPDILNDEDIEHRAQEYRQNIIQMVIVLTLLVLAGALFVFYVIAMRPIVSLIDVIRRSQAPNLLRFDGRIPGNEIGELIRARERQLDRIAGYETRLENQVDELRREVIQSEKLGMLGELSAGIIHDLNNPVQLLTFHLDDLDHELKSSHSDNVKIMEAVQGSKFATGKIQALIQRMTGFVRKTSQSPGYFNISDTVADAVDLLRSKLNKSGIEVAINVPDELQCYGCEQDVEQLVVNLASNAIDAMETTSCPRLEISARMNHENWLEIIVKDTGIGIPERIQDDIFKSLFTTKPGGKGTGLGLSNVSRIVADHQGKIELYSAPEQGSEFRVSLPGRKFSTLTQSLDYLVAGHTAH